MVSPGSLVFVSSACPWRFPSSAYECNLCYDPLVSLGFPTPPSPFGGIFLTTGIRMTRTPFLTSLFLSFSLKKIFSLSIPCTTPLFFERALHFFEFDPFFFSPSFETLIDFIFSARRRRLGLPLFFHPPPSRDLPRGACMRSCASVFFFLEARRRQDSLPRTTILVREPLSFPLKFLYFPLLCVLHVRILLARPASPVCFLFPLSPFFLDSSTFSETHSLEFQFLFSPFPAGVECA